MSISLSRIANNKAPLTFQYDGETVNLVYYPSRVTEKVFAQLQSFSKMNEANMTEGFASFNAMLVNLIESWDVFEDDAQTTVFPLDADRLAELPFAFRVQLIGAIMGDIRPERIASQGSI